MVFFDIDFAIRENSFRSLSESALSDSALARTTGSRQGTARSNGSTLCRNPPVIP